LNDYITKDFKRKLATYMAQKTEKDRKYIYADFLTPICRFFDEKIEEIQMEEQRHLSEKEIQDYLLNGFALELKRKYKGELGVGYDDDLDGNIGKFFSVLRDFVADYERGKWENSLDVLHTMEK